MIPDLTKISIDNLYLFKVKKLFNRCGYSFYRVRDYDRLAGIPDIYFYNETFSAWASLKVNEKFIPGPGKKFKPDFKRGEIVFLKKMKEIKNVKSLIIMEFKEAAFYSTEIKASYDLKDLLPFDLKNFII